MVFILFRAPARGSSTSISVCPSLSLLVFVWIAIVFMLVKYASNIVNILSVVRSVGLFCIHFHGHLLLYPLKDSGNVKKCWFTDILHEYFNKISRRSVSLVPDVPATKLNKQLLMFIRTLLTLLVSRLYPYPLPSAFDLSSSIASHDHPATLSSSSSSCHIFTRPAFSQHECGACAAFAVATAYAMRECVRGTAGAVIPSPHRLFDCSGGTCEDGVALSRVVRALNRGVRGVDDSVQEFGAGCSSGEGGESEVKMIPAPCFFFCGSGLSMFHVAHSDILAFKTELFVFRNPVLAVVVPDVEMSLYPYSLDDIENSYSGHSPNSGDDDGCIIWVQRKGNETVLSYQPSAPGHWVRVRGSHHHRVGAPVYHITGERLNNHVLVVLGWGSDPEPHWVVQNSWGHCWGERGRGKIAMSDVEAAVVLDSGWWNNVWTAAAVVAVALAVGVVLDVLLGCGGGEVQRRKEKTEGPEEDDALV